MSSSQSYNLNTLTTTYNGQDPQGDTSGVNENAQLAEITKRGKNIWLDVQQDYAAIGDGNSHPLSTIFPTLVLAQMKYPCATALTNEIDWCAIQTAINDASAQASTTQDFGGGIVYCPPGKYIASSTIKMKLFVFLYGSADPAITQIFLANGANCDILQSPNAAGNAPYGGDKFGIKGIMFDGNETNQTVKANGLNIPDAFIGGFLRDVAIRNVYGTGLIGGSDLAIENLWISYCTDGGWKFTGGQFTAKHVFLENMFTNQTITTGATTAQRTNAPAAPGLIITNTNINDKLSVFGLHTESCEPAVQIINSPAEVTIASISATDSALGNGSSRNNAITVDSISTNYRFIGIRQDSYTNSTILNNGIVVTTNKNVSSYDSGVFYESGKHLNHGAIEQQTNAWFRLGQSGPDTTVQAGTMYWDNTNHVIKVFDGTSWKTVTMA